MLHNIAHVLYIASYTILMKRITLHHNYTYTSIILLFFRQVMKADSFILDQNDVTRYMYKP